MMIGITAQKRLFLIVILRIRLANKADEIASKQRERTSCINEPNIPQVRIAANITIVQIESGTKINCKAKNIELFFLNQTKLPASLSCKKYRAAANAHIKSHKANIPLMGDIRYEFETLCKPEVSCANKSGTEEKR
jgi:hypothetical protein